MSKTPVQFLETRVDQYRRGWDSTQVRHTLERAGFSTSILGLDASEGALHGQLDHLPGVVYWPTFFGIPGSERSIQEYLDEAGLPFVGCRGSSAALHAKLKLKTSLQSIGIRTPKYAILHDGPELLGRFRYPVVLKNDASCNSWDVMRIEDRQQLADEIIAMRGRSPAGRLYVEEWVRDREFTVAYLPPYGRDQALVAPMELELQGPKLYLDREAKSDDSLLTFSAPEPETSRRLALLTAQIAELLALDGHFRLDVLQDRQGDLHVIDLNLVPFMNWSPEAKSYFPRAFDIAGVHYLDVLTRVIQHALHRSMPVFS